MTFELVKFKDVDLGDEFFDSLKSSYQEFPEWFASKAENKAYTSTDESGKLNGFLYIKNEDGPVTDVNPPLPPAKRLKMGTFKIDAHGTKLGERFLKKVFDYAAYGEYKEIYLTVFEKHAPLINLLQTYGFESIGTKTTKNGTELVMLRSMKRTYKSQFASYPLVSLKNSKTHLVAIFPEWHTRLLPDSILKTENPKDVVKDISHTNSIRKVYIGAAPGLRSINPGDVIVTYRTGDGQGPARFRAVATSIGVAEVCRNIKDFSSEEEFIKFCGAHSVFSQEELSEYWEKKYPPYIIKFTYNIALTKRPTRGDLIDVVGLNEAARWSHLQLQHSEFLKICKLGGIDESLIIH